MTGRGAKSHAEAAATTCPHLRPAEQQTARVDTTRARPRVPGRNRRRKLKLFHPHPQKTEKKKKNYGYKYQQRPWYSARRWRECQGSIIYAAQRKPSDPTAPADGAAACLRRRFGARSH